MKALAWDPPEMLGMIVDVYLHLFAADAGGASSPPSPPTVARTATRCSWRRARF